MEMNVRGKVLCVEDNFDECDLVREVLSDFDVKCVSTIAEACRLLAEQHYSLIIIDEHLPDGSGLGLCARISDKNAHTPRLIVTGDAYVTNAEAVKCGAKALLTKSRVDYVEELRLFAGHYARSACA
jgi:DNA-binding NtrC family response regulator